MQRDRRGRTVAVGGLREQVDQGLHRTPNPLQALPGAIERPATAQIVRVLRPVL